jgi:hypothetical protein
MNNSSSKKMNDIKAIQNEIIDAKFFEENIITNTTFVRNNKMVENTGRGQFFEIILLKSDESIYNPMISFENNFNKAACSNMMELENSLLISLNFEIMFKNSNLILRRTIKTGLNNIIMSKGSLKGGLWLIVIKI